MVMSHTIVVRSKRKIEQDDFVAFCRLVEILFEEYRAPECTLEDEYCFSIESRYLAQRDALLTLLEKKNWPKLAVELADEAALEAVRSFFRGEDDYKEFEECLDRLFRNITEVQLAKTS